MTGGPLYSPGDFDDYMERKEAPERRGAHLVTRDSPPSWVKVNALREADKRFTATMDMKRTDLKDQTPSSYCLSLGCQLAMVGWDDQEITDFLVWWRREHNASEKPPGWYRITLDNARSLPAVSKEGDKVKQIERVTTATEPEERLAALSQFLGFTVRRVVRRITIDKATGIAGEPWFLFETELGTIDLTTERLRTKGMFLNDCYGKLGRNVEIPAKLWPQVSQAIADSWVTEDGPEEASANHEIRDLLREYSDRKTVTDDPVQAHDGGQVLERDGVRWVSLTRFCDWARKSRSVHTGQRGITKALSVAGCKRVKLDNLMRGTKRTSITFWSIS
jgi:hypothetical protein